MKKKFRVKRMFVFLGKALWPDQIIETNATLGIIKKKIKTGYLEEIRDEKSVQTKKKRTGKDAEQSIETGDRVQGEKENPDAS